MDVLALSASLRCRFFLPFTCLLLGGKFMFDFIENICFSADTVVEMQDILDMYEPTCSALIVAVNFNYSWLYLFRP